MCSFAATMNLRRESAELLEHENRGRMKISDETFTAARIGSRLYSKKLMTVIGSVVWPGRTRNSDSGTSLNEMMNAKVTPENRPGLTSGNRTNLTRCHRLAPRLRAARSRLWSKLNIDVATMRVVNGRVSTTWAAIRAGVPRSPRAR